MTYSLTMLTLALLWAPGTILVEDSDGRAIPMPLIWVKVHNMLAKAQRKG